ncbi:MAG: flagellar hook-length control protein FliK, partial [Spirochaetaceae bacterium]|nr:flagellar hook-length control protein FliK [Spirochaetaceae bacterium]
DREARSAATFVEKTKRTAGKADRLPLSFVDADPVRREIDHQDHRFGQKGRIRTALSVKKTETAADNPTAGRSAIVPFPGRNDLSGSARRVEVVDRRNEQTLDEMHRMTRGKSAKLSVDAESRHTATEKSEGFSNVIRGEIAETDIELSPRIEQRSTGRSAAAELARKLDSQAGSDIVRQVKVVLNRSEAGEVRINLRPDNLGRVRIRIRMEDNRLTGRIFVESAAAREAFKAALDGLQTKLVESGFGAADLELAWDDSYQGFEQQGQNPGGQNRSSGAVAREFDNMVPTTVVDEAADGRVNMVV